jgi:hypothetical protein
MQYFKLVVVLLILIVFSANAQQKVKTKLSRKVPKVSLAINGGFGYVVSSANGEGTDFKSTYNTPGGHVFDAKNLGMQQGYGIGVTAKFVVSKNKKLSVTGTTGYNLFYNSQDQGMNRTKWNIINLGAGVEYNFTPKQKESLFIGADLNYNLMFGAWQSNVVYPDGYKSNAYTKFRPSSRFGMSVTTGMQFKMNKRSDFFVALKGVWVNLIPKQNYYTNEPYSTYINDSGNSNGIELSGRKEVIYIQIIAGVNLPLRY